MPKFIETCFYLNVFVRGIEVDMFPPVVFRSSKSLFKWTLKRTFCHLCCIRFLSITQMGFTNYFMGIFRNSHKGLQEQPLCLTIGSIIYI